jgi:hypothetical protein
LCEKLQKVREFVVKKCDKEGEIIGFIEKCMFGDKLDRNSRNEAND